MDSLRLIHSRQEISLNFVSLLKLYVIGNYLSLAGHWSRCRHSFLSRGAALALFFVMCENLSIKSIGTDRMANDLTKREKKYLILDKSLHTLEYDHFTEVDMHESIKLS